MFNCSMLLNDNKIFFLGKKKIIVLLLLQCFILSVIFSRSWTNAKHENVINSWDRGTEILCIFHLSLVDAFVCQNPPIRGRFWFQAPSSTRPSLLNQPMGARWGSAARGCPRSEEVPKNSGDSVRSVTLSDFIMWELRRSDFSEWGRISQRDSWHRRDVRPADGKECAEEVIFSRRLVGGNSPRSIVRPRVSLS